MVQTGHFELLRYLNQRGLRQTRQVAQIWETINAYTILFGRPLGEWNEMRS